MYRNLRFVLALFLFAITARQAGAQSSGAELIGY